MGYTTDFSGSFSVTPPLKQEHVEYLEAFAASRRMKRDATIAQHYPDPKRAAAGLPIGIEGGYYVGSEENFGQNDTPDVLNHNEPPQGQPGLWCQWVPAEDGEEIEWDGGEKFYYYVEWLTYLIEHFLKPWGYTLNGQVEWVGEDPSDIGRIDVEANTVRERAGRIEYS